jgi:hypothetical protein
MRLGNDSGRLRSKAFDAACSLLRKAVTIRGKRPIRSPCSRGHDQRCPGFGVVGPRPPAPPPLQRAGAVTSLSFFLLSPASPFGSHLRGSRAGARREGNRCTLGVSRISAARQARQPRWPTPNPSRHQAQTIPCSRGHPDRGARPGHSSASRSITAFPHRWVNAGTLTCGSFSYCRRPTARG